MKKGRQARNTGRMNSGGGGSRASAAIAVDRATYAETSAGGSSGNGANTSSAGGSRIPDDKPTIGSVSIARSWSEGKYVSLTDGDDGARVPMARDEPERALGFPNWANGIRVRDGRREEAPSRSSPKYLQESIISNTPQDYPKLNPSHPLKNLPHKTPQTFPKYTNNPRPIIPYPNPPQHFPELQTDPHIAKTLHITPQQVPHFENQPSIPCQNSFDALACSSTSSLGPKDPHWIFDCGATDTISFEASDFISLSKAKKSYVQTASGDLAQVMGAGTINISPTLCLPNCLYVPSLSHKLLSISHVTKELNCKLLMQPQFCMLQDIKTGTIVGRGTERCGLYYVDEIAHQSAAMILTPGPTERQAWLWHRRLGHPSLGYFRLLFPALAKTLFIVILVL